jgi:succinate dehydrogenase / fumarate reductase cytochrome b subunit
VADTTIEHPGFLERNDFLIRRLHSLTGIIPVGVFLCVHLTVNATVIFGGDKFQTAVDGIHLLHRIGLLYLVEIVGIFIPLAFHAILGVQIWLSGQQNMLAYRYGASIRYALQRWSGVIALVFILYHLWHMHWLGSPFGGSHFDPEDAPYTAATALQTTGWYTPAYVLGLLCSVFHFANGIWTFLITWGVTISREAQRKAGYVCLAVGLLLTAAGLASLAALKFTDPAEFRSVGAEVRHVASASPGQARNTMPTRTEQDGS